MSSSMAAALILSDLIAGRGMERADVFSPGRFRAPAAALAEQTGQTVKGIALKPLTPAKDRADALAPGHGGVVEYDGQKAGAYRDEDGKVYWVDVRCPHMGCQLEWNPDEKSWDCPCHGSRFDFRGRLLDNPAQEDISHE